MSHSRYVCLVLRFLTLGLVIIPFDWALTVFSNLPEITHAYGHYFPFQYITRCFRTSALQEFQVNFVVTAIISHVTIKWLIPQDEVIVAHCDDDITVHTT